MEKHGLSSVNVISLNHDENASCITGPLYGESTGGYLSQMAWNAELWHFLSYQREEAVEQTVELHYFETPWRSCNVITMVYFLPNG